MFSKAKVGNDIYGVKGKSLNPGDTCYERLADSPETGFRHSKHYHEYFRGYTEVRRSKPNGKYSIERYYTKPWQVLDVSDRKYWFIRAIYALLAAVAALTYIFVMTRPDVPSNACWYVAIPGFPAMILIFLNSIVTAIYIFAPRKMTYWDLKASSGRLKKVSLATGADLSLNVLAIIIFIILNKETNMAGEFSNVIGVSFSAACVFTLHLLEKSMKYKEVKNETDIPKGETYEI